MPLFLRFFGARLARTATILAAVAALSFTLASFSPIDPVDAYMGPRILTIGPGQRELIAERWGLHQPPLVRFAKWAGNLLSGDFGQSLIYNEPVSQVIAKRFRTSLWLMGCAWTLSGLLGYALGIFAGLFRDSPFDRATRLYAYVLASTPAFWIGLVLLSIFSVSLGWTPICCAAPPGLTAENVGLGQRIHHLILPALTLSVIGVAQITLHVREKMLDVMQSEYALYAKAMGETRWGFVTGHALRATALPALTVQFASLGELFGGSVLAEQVFSYPGLGKATVEAGLRGDIPLLLGVAIFSALFVCAGNMIADALYFAVDPRIRAGEATA